MTNADALAGYSPRRTVLDRFLSFFSSVGAGEGAGAILLALNVFILLGTYYILKTVREPLILNQPGGAEVKSYSAAGQAVLFLLIVPLYGAFASRVNRLWLISGVTAFFISNLAIFFALGTAGVGVGIPYYLWVGIFNMMVVAQFWAFANDIYTEEQGKRLFPIVGVGASLGAWVGSLSAGYLLEYLGLYQLMLVAAGLLTLCIVLTWTVHRRERGRTTEEKAKEAEQPLDRKGGFQLVLRHRYLRLIALLVLLLNLVNTLGGYLLDQFVIASAQAIPAAERGKFIGQFYADFFSWANLLGFLIQTFLVARVFQWIGVRGGLFVLPLIAMAGYGILAVLPILAIVRVAKILENATDYSLNNTVRHALFLPTSREEKYKGKAATDTFFVRLGDMFQAGIVFAGVQLGLSISNLAVVNLVIVGAWLAVAVAIYREHKRLTTEA
ncbi:MAG: MFS transporter [Bryobacterales bacterium]|nr:MFS transporter [Bryobacterales bacterium]